MYFMQLPLELGFNKLTCKIKASEWVWVLEKRNKKTCGFILSYLGTHTVHLWGSFLFFLDFDFLNYLLHGDSGDPVKGAWACGRQERVVILTLSLSTIGQLSSVSSSAKREGWTLFTWFVDNFQLSESVVPYFAQMKRHNLDLMQRMSQKWLFLWTGITLRWGTKKKTLSPSWLLCVLEPGNIVPQEP